MGTLCHAVSGGIASLKPAAAGHDCINADRQRGLRGNSKRLEQGGLGGKALSPRNANRTSTDAAAMASPTTVLLIHGALLDRKSMLALLPHLPAECGYVAPDLAGHGSRAGGSLPERLDAAGPVSYTHLTLPTILLV